METWPDISDITMTRGPNRYDAMMSLFESKRVSFRDDGSESSWYCTIEAMTKSSPLSTSEWTNDWWDLVCTNVVLPAMYDRDSFPANYGKLYLKYNLYSRKGKAAFYILSDDRTRLLPKTWNELIFGSSS